MLRDIHVGEEVKKLQRKPKVDGRIIIINFGKVATGIMIPDGAEYFFVTPEKPVDYARVYAQ